MTKPMVCMFVLWCVLFACVAGLMLLHVNLQQNLSLLQQSMNKTQSKCLHCRSYHGCLV